MDILLVEDSATLRANMEAVLRKMGHRVHGAESGEKCLHLIEESRHSQRYDMVLMDVELPGLDGFETTRLLREMLDPQWIPIIFVTAVTDEASYAKGIEAGGDDYLAKPVSAVILKAKIRALERIANMQRRMARVNRALKSTSDRDTLTNLLNRRAFNARAERRWQHARQRGLTTAVIMLDVDFFKQYNDNYGHMAGDHCLRLVAAAIRSGVGEDSHLLARYGGEEFIVLLSDTSQEEARALAEELRQAVHALDIEHIGSPARRLSISAGVAVTHNLGSHTLDKLISAADKQLYRVKTGGRNRTSCVELDNHKTILICLNDSADQSYLAGLLANRGNIVTAENGTECIDIATYIVPDLVLIGSAVRSSPGSCTCGALRAHEATATVPIILVREDRSPIYCHQSDGRHCVNSLCELARVEPVVERFLH